MKKKSLLYLLFALVLTLSCGPRRYGCDPRRCEIKVEPKAALKHTVEKSRTSLSYYKILIKLSPETTKTLP